MAFGDFLKLPRQPAGARMQLDPMRKVTPDILSEQMGKKLAADKSLFKEQGLVGIASKGLENLGSGLNVGKEAATTLLSGAMEGTGKLFYGQDNKPSFGMNDLQSPPASIMPEQKPVDVVPPVLMDLPQDKNIVDNSAIGKQLNPTPVQSVEAAKPIQAGASATTPAKTEPKTVGIPTATGVDGVSRLTDSQGKVTYSDAPAIAQRPIELNPLTNTVGINGSVKTAPTVQSSNDLTLSPLNGTGAGGMNYSIPNTASKVGGSTPQERYDLQQQELAQPQQQEGRGTVSLPPAQIGGVDVQEAIAKNMDIVNNASAANDVGDLLKVKYAQHALDGYMGKDTANAGLQLKQIDQVQEQGKQKQAADNEAWNRLLQSSQFNYGVQKDQQQLAAGERNAQAAGGIKLAELENAKQQQATTNALELKKLNRPIFKTFKNIDGSESVGAYDADTGKLRYVTEPKPEEES